MRVTTCPYFVRNADSGLRGSTNPADFLGTSICQAKYAGRLSSCRKRLRSISRPRLALHDVLPLGLGPDGTITLGDEIPLPSPPPRPVLSLWTIYALFASVRICASIRRGSAQIVRIPRFFGPTARRRAVVRHRAGSGWLRTRDPACPRLLVRKSKSTSPQP